MRRKRFLQQNTKSTDRLLIFSILNSRAFLPQHSKNIIYKVVTDSVIHKGEKGINIKYKELQIKKEHTNMQLPYNSEILRRLF